MIEHDQTWIDEELSDGEVFQLETDIVPVLGRLSLRDYSENITQYGYFLRTTEEEKPIEGERPPKGHLLNHYELIIEGIDYKDLDTIILGNKRKDIIDVLEKFKKLIPKTELINIYNFTTKYIAKDMSYIYTFSPLQNADHPILFSTYFRDENLNYIDLKQTFSSPE